MEQFVDASFNRNFTQHYSLLMELERQQLAFVIYDKSTGKIAALKRITFPQGINGSDFSSRLKNIINAEDILHIPVKETKISIAWPAFMLVPETLFEEELAGDYLKYNTHVAEKETTEVNYIRGLTIKNVFVIYKELKKYLSATFPNAKIFHTSTALLEYIQAHKNDMHAAQLIFDVRQDHMHIIYLENKELKFCNQFQFKNKEDFLYFALLVSDQLQIDRNVSDLKLCGYIIEDSVLYNELYKFFRNIGFINTPDHLKLPAASEITSLHYYTTLFSLHLCA
ncbi:MAG: DUF3822 family protein [Fimbriimonadaceae bacterium]|nr:DUF3822 family protein [Chitinophagales bacterium]